MGDVGNHPPARALQGRVVHKEEGVGRHGPRAAQHALLQVVEHARVGQHVTASNVLGRSCMDRPPSEESTATVEVAAELKECLHQYCVMAPRIMRCDFLIA